MKQNIEWAWMMFIDFVYLRKNSFGVTVIHNKTIVYTVQIITPILLKVTYYYVCGFYWWFEIRCDRFKRLCKEKGIHLLPYSFEQEAKRLLLKGHKLQLALCV